MSGPHLACPACGHANPGATKFCHECGTPLARQCAKCGVDLAPSMKFCGDCGTAVAAKPSPVVTPAHLADKIRGARTALEGERKQVTVLFADVKGSMTLAEGADPEAFHRVMERTARLLADGVHRYEGTVTQYTGDGVMALFGAPIAHEDHAQRACFTALHLRETLGRYADELRLSDGLNLSLRIGVNSGEVVVGRIGDDLKMDYTAQGHTVGLAARMEQIAAADRAYVSEHTARIVDGYFRLRDLGPLAVKGASEPVRVYELEDVGALKTRLDVSQTRGFSRFVGRIDEVATLEAALARAMEGHGQVIGVVAEPGVGKSRLCWEFVQRCRARGIAVQDAHCVPHGKTIPYLPVLELLRKIHGVTEQDRPQTAREKIAGRLLLLDEGLRESLPLVFDFMGVPDPEHPLPRMDPEARQRQLLAVVRRSVLARSRRETAVTVIEDLHWLDGASEGFVETLVDAAAGTRTLLLVNFRPEYHAGWMQRSYYQQLPLLPLGSDAIEELLRELLGTGSALAGLVRLIRERTGGNPFFVEEVVRSLAESGVLSGTRGAYWLAKPVEAIALPTTVQAILAARIDRLGEREKTVLQTGAVVGKEFPESILQRVVDLEEADLASALRALVAAEFFYEEALYPEPVYAFKHPLTQEVAYRSQLGERRRQLHTAVARAIEEAYPTKLDEQAALLAQHWDAAGEPFVAATWHQRAAGWIGVRDRAETLRHWSEVRRLLATVPVSPEALALGVMARDAMLLHGLFCGMTDDEAHTLFTEGMALAEDLQEPSSRIRLLTRLGSRKSLTGIPEEALAPLEEARRLAAETGDPFLEFLTRFSLSGAAMNLGHLEDAIVHLDHCMVACGGDPEYGAGITGFSVLAYLLAVRGFALANQGHWMEALRSAERATEIARQRRDLEMLMIGGTAGLVACEMMGDAPGALAHGTESMRAAEAGAEGLRQSALWALGRAHLMQGEWRGAIDMLAASLAQTRTARTGLAQEGMILAFLADAHRGAGDLGRAREMADEAVAVARRRRTRIFEIVALLARARVLLAADGPSPGVERDLDDATALIE
ncbi:MAG TPA: adenylate/guanylate cyclase domain-containing protein, partial [Candidatus Eisenbacteria bacterium]|nr:adenylate/guanylate cyclase domain-containing protein [Candidatus Eisenbacteria bacterium]